MRPDSCSDSNISEPRIKRSIPYITEDAAHRMSIITAWGQKNCIDVVAKERLTKAESEERQGN